MRTQPRFGYHVPPLDAWLVHDVVTAQNLAAARLQPSYSSRMEFWLDVIFARDGAYAVIPFVQIEAPMLTVRESSPFMWPEGVTLDAARVTAIEAEIEPWLQAIAFQAAVDSEAFRLFTSDPRAIADIERAMSAGFLGTVAAERLYVDAGPYVYAQRFARGKTVGIHSPEASYGAALLQRVAGLVRADLGDPSLNELASAWYGHDIFGPLDAARFDVGVGIEPSRCAIRIDLEARDASRRVEVVAPAFPTVAASFDPSDAPVERVFSIDSPAHPSRERMVADCPIIGGSAGRIGLVIRDDGFRSPDADTDEARALASALNAQGFDAGVVLASAATVTNFDLIHAFGHRHATQFGDLFSRARDARIPIVWSPHLDDAQNESAWAGHVANMLAVGTMDNAMRNEVGRAFNRRLLEFGQGIPRGTPAYDGQAVGRLFESANAVIAVGSGEESRIRQMARVAGAIRTVAAVLGPEPAPEDVAWLTGADAYVFVHAQFDVRGNAVAVVRAAAQLDLPCVIAGAVDNVDYYQFAMAQAGPRTVWIPEERLTPGQIAALYGGSRVFVDASWSGHGAARALRAAAYGSALVLSSALPSSALWPGLAQIVDPALPSSIATAIHHAWSQASTLGPDTARRTAERYAPLPMLQATLGAYAQASSAVAQLAGRT